MRPQLLVTRLILKLQRLRDPQVQVWMMAGVSVLLLLIGHLRAWHPTGGEKIDSHASTPRLLLAGAGMAWREDFATARPHREVRPVLVLATDGMLRRKTHTHGHPALPLRPAMQTAAGLPWRALDRTLRHQLSAAGVPAAPLEIHLLWSGDTRGNAALVYRRQLAPSGPAVASSGVVIGNGSRSGDGEIEWLSPAFSLSSGVAEITLIGPQRRITSSQLAALAELLVHLEALSGHRLKSLAGSPGADPAFTL